MKVCVGYVIATLIGTVLSQSLLSLLQSLQAQPRILQIRGNDISNAAILQQNLVPQSRAMRTRASASSSVGLAALGINELLSRSGLLTSLHPSLSNIAVHRGARIIRPRTSTFIADQRLPAGLHSGVPAVSAVPASIPAGVQVAGVPATGIQTSGVGTTMLFDQPDSQTPEAPDLVYAPRSMMGDMQQVEALRNRAEADGVVFV